MYRELFHLNQPPFRLSPDPEFLFASKQHTRAKAYMESTVWLADGFVVITGEIGSGKTTLIECFLEELGDDVIIAHINQTQLSPVEFLQALLVEFGFKPFGKEKIELLSMLKDYLVKQYAAGRKVLLIIDEAQNLSKQVLEEVRMLSGIEARKEKPLRIILAGQPQLSEKLDSPELEQLTQRVRLRFHLGPLSREETQDYIEHRLAVAGSQGRKIFTDDSFDLIYRYSGGVPRLTNILCDTAMLCAFGEECDCITAELVAAAVDELQWKDYAERKGLATPKETTGNFRQVVVASPSVDLLLGSDLVERFTLTPGRVIIGRTPDNDLQIPSQFISRRHAQITQLTDRWILEDLKSTNGMFFQGRRVQRHVFADGDAIQLGEHSLVFHAANGQGLEDEPIAPALRNPDDAYSQTRVGDEEGFNRND